MLTVSGERLAEFLDVEVSDLRLLVEAGMPAPHDDSKFDFSPALHWYVQRQRQIATEGGLGTTEENAERLRVENDLRVQEQFAFEKLQLDAEIGKLRQLEPAQEELFQHLSILRERVLAIPGRYSHRLSGLTVGQIRERLTEITETVFTTARPVGL
jgi:phage terminase Nu1 subunit (DNA packaging protein)